MVARFEGRGHLGLGPARADRHAVAERLGHRDDVGHHTEPLVTEPRAAAAEAGLHLVDHEEDPALVAEPADALEVLGGGGVDAALALHGFEQHRGHRRIEGRLERVEVVPGDVPEALGQRLERLVLGRLPGGVQRGQGAAVERAEGAHDDVAAAAAELPGQLEGALVGLGPGVGEEHLAPGALGGPARLAGAEQPVERAGHLPADVGAEEVGDVQQRLGLLVQRGGHRRVAVAEAGDGEAREQVEVPACRPCPTATTPRRARAAATGGP